MKVIRTYEIVGIASLIVLLKTIPDHLINLRDTDPEDLGQDLLGRLQLQDLNGDEINRQDRLILRPSHALHKHFHPPPGSTFNLKSSSFLNMIIELLPTVSLIPETFNVLLAPAEMVAGVLNSNLKLQRYKILFVCGNYSRILSRLDRKFTELDIRRAFTSFQLMTILEENRHSFLIIEHDPLLYEDATDMVEYVAQDLKQTSREATILLIAPALDPHLEKMTELADRVFCFYEMPKAQSKARAKIDLKISGAQATLEAYS